MIYCTHINSHDAHFTCIYQLACYLVKLIHVIRKHVLVFHFHMTQIYNSSTNKYNSIHKNNYSYKIQIQITTTYATIYILISVSINIF